MKTPAQTVKIPLPALSALRKIAAFTGEKQHEVLTRLLIVEMDKIASRIKS